MERSPAAGAFYFTNKTTMQLVFQQNRSKRDSHPQTSLRSVIGQQQTFVSEGSLKRRVLHQRLSLSLGIRWLRFLPPKLVGQIVIGLFSRLLVARLIPAHTSAGCRCVAIDRDGFRRRACVFSEPRIGPAS